MLDGEISVFQADGTKAVVLVCFECLLVAEYVTKLRSITAAKPFLFPNVYMPVSMIFFFFSEFTNKVFFANSFYIPVLFCFKIVLIVIQLSLFRTMFSKEKDAG